MNDKQLAEATGEPLATVRRLAFQGKRSVLEKLAEDKKKKRELSMMKGMKRMITITMQVSARETFNLEAFEQYVTDSYRSIEILKIKSKETN
jgi:hypothetical protein